ncbi:hypothetical protein [Streptomyces sp. NPDC054887]
MSVHYPYRIRSNEADHFLIWRPGEGDFPDQFMTDNGGRPWSLHDRTTLQKTCDREGWELNWEGEGSLDLTAVRRWVEGSDRDSPSAELLLEAWNFFDDLSYSTRTGTTLPSRGPTQDNAYEKLFAGDSPPANGVSESWTEEETAAVRELLRAGLDLWRTDGQ